jgi:hypothetical protein
MLQGMIELVLLMGLVGLVWVIVLDIRGGNHHPQDKRQGSASPKSHNG